MLPTNEASDEDKEPFYQALHDETSKVPKHDMFIEMGDLNAKIGAENKGMRI